MALPGVAAILGTPLALAAGDMRAPLFHLAAPLLLGLLLGLCWPGPWFALLSGAVACALLAWPATRLTRAALACAVLLLGWAAPAGVQPGPELDGRVGLRGEVLALRAGGAQLVEISAWSSAGRGWAPARGRVLVDFGEERPRPGQALVAWGQARELRVSLLPGAPDGERVAVLAGARSRLTVRRWLPLGGARPPPPAPPDCRHHGLLRALATGDRSQLPEELPALLRATGTSHLLAISGLHLGLVAGLLGWLGTRLARALLRWRGRSHAWVVGALCMALGALAYGQLAGWPVSAVRACWMLLGVGAALALGRGRDPRQLLGLAAFATVLGEPAMAATASWQLSFGALLGLVLLTPRLVRALPPDLCWPLDRAARGAAATIAATLGTLPAAAWWFQELALYAVPANLVALPLVGMVATPGALLSVALPGLAGELAAAVACGALDLALGWLGLMRGPTLHPAVGPLGALALVALPLLARRPVLGSLVALVVLGLRLRPRAWLVISFLAVGQGNAALVEWPDGRRWLVDGGPDRQAVLHHLRRRGVRRLDVVAATHGHPDHIGGLAAVVEELEVDALWSPRPARPDEEDLTALLGAARARGVEPSFPGDPAIPALHPLDGWAPRRPSANEESLVLLLAHGLHSILLTGDIEGQGEAALLPSLGPVDVLGVPHHGSRSSSTDAFVQRLRPRVAVLSCGRDNRFGHPHPTVLGRYRAVDSLPLRTDLHGTVEIRSDGLELEARSWLPGAGWREWEIPER
jgi:competence protein ComEC